MGEDNAGHRLVATHDADGVRTITLDRPARHNALVPDLLDQLVTAIETTATELAAVVLAATSPSFSTGGDVAEFAARHGDERATFATRMVGRLNNAILALMALPQPVIAAVHGPVTGGSLGLVLACDLVVVGPKAWFAPYYVDVGFSPDGGWTALLPARIGATRAGAVQLTNTRITPDEALAWGLASHLDEDPVATAHDLAHAIADKVATSVAATTALLTPDLDVVARALEREREQFVAQVTTPEATAGMAAFLDDRSCQ